MKNRCWSLALVSFLSCSLRASQDEPFHLTHAQRVAQEQAQRLSVAQKKCVLQSQEIRDRLTYQCALATVQKRAETEKKAARITARQDILPESLLNTFAHPLRAPEPTKTDIKSAEPTPKIESGLILATYSPKVACPLSRKAPEGNEEHDSPTSDFLKLDEGSSLRKNSVSQWLHSPSSLRSLGSDYTGINSPEDHSIGSFEITHNSLSPCATIKKIFCCCGDGS